MIVMKFGGTSVQDAKAISRVSQIVQGRLADRPVVVVSAMAKVTDALLAMGAEFDKQQVMNQLKSYYAKAA